MRFIKWAGVVFAMAVLAGCAHPYTVRPDLAKIQRDPSAERIDANVAYYMSSEDLDKQVTTSASGGDRVRYQPYKDIEAGFYKMLTNVFTKVSKARTPTPSPAENNAYVIQTSISTESSGSSMLWWPPSNMSMSLTCTIMDTTGRQVAQIRVTGEGKATSDEFLGHLTLTGERASEDALIKMQKALLAAPELRH
ncbi:MULTISPECIES: hypothetical protein [unclassified Achromobacter]|uniref:hypothetical protein n=1 Tax=unclassified Achromobacter TaxID=2626865 RepID=UPI000B517736|nr:MULTISPECIES: hypothetical protein [unclassified Achromobacter]OWT75012.1 hypothetical protein CEY04_20860 [Achromobacter sp. HZ28]OWT76621.1 hypothetical protein CEY05_16315 [Achromobacter sp. HZ34]